MPLQADQACRAHDAALNAVEAWRGFDVIEINNNAGYMPHYLQASGLQSMPWIV